MNNQEKLKLPEDEPKCALEDLPSEAYIAALKAAAPVEEGIRGRGFAIAGFLITLFACSIFFILHGLNRDSVSPKAVNQDEFWKLARLSRKIRDKEDKEYALSHQNRGETSNRLSRVAVPDYRSGNTATNPRQDIEPESGSASSEDYLAEQNQAAQNAMEARKSELQVAIQSWCSTHSQGSYSYSLFRYDMTSSTQASFSIAGRKRQTREDAMLDGGAGGMPSMSYFGSAVYGSFGWSVNVMGL